MPPSDDEQHLRLLSLFHYVVAGMAAFFASIPLVHVIVGLVMMVSSLFQTKDGPALALLGVFFAFMGGIFVLVGWSLAACIAYAGKCLARRRNYQFCLIMAGLECMFSPPGTVLGVFTIIVLLRPTVKSMFLPPLPTTPLGSPGTA